MRSVLTRIFALVAALIMLLSSGAPARSRYYCRMMGGPVASCCCSTDARVQSPKHAQELQSADCCERISPSVRSAPLSTREAVHDIAAAAALPPICESLVANPDTDTGTSCNESTQAPLAIGPPLFVAHCALLS